MGWFIFIWKVRFKDNSKLKLKWRSVLGWEHSGSFLLLLHTRQCF